MAGRFSVETVFKAVDKVTAPITKMQNRVGKFTRSARRGFDSLNNSIDKVTGAIRSGIGGATLTLGAATAATGLLVTEMNRASVEAETLAAAVSFPVDDLEALTGAVSGAGFEIDNVVDLIEEMNNKIGESTGLADQITPVEESLSILGLKFSEISKMSPEKQFKAIANAALAMEDAQKAAAAADILLGGEANKIIGTLRAQGGTIDEIIDRYKALSFRTAESRHGAQLFRDQQIRLMRTIISFGQEISGLIGLHIGPLIEKIVDWTAANKELLRAPVLRFLDSLSSAVVTFLSKPMPERVKEISGAISEWIDKIDNAWTWLKRIGGAVGILFGIQAALNVASAAMTVFNAIVAANPFVLVGAAIIATAALVWIYWEPISEFFVNMWNTITAAFENGWARIERDSMRVVENFKAAWGGLKQFFVDLWNDITGIFTGGLNRVTGAVNSVKGFLGFGGGDDDAQISSPQERTARNIDERRSINKSEVTIKDQTGRAEVTQGALGNGLNLQTSGAF